MSQAVEYRKFPKGEYCTTEGCRSRRYYEDAGGRFCKAHGHRQEGFTQVQADEDDFENQTKGRRTRRKKEREEVVSKILAGRKATELYVACLQLVLWKQVRGVEGQIGWRGTEREGELEAVVRDLWAVRLRAVKDLEEGIAGMSSGGESQSEGAGFYSSASELESGSEAAPSVVSSSGRMKSRRKRKENGVPKLTDLLGMCYLGCLLLRQPVSLGELLEWVQKDEIVYLRVMREVPQEMYSRLPGYYMAALETRAPLRVDDLHSIVLELSISFKHRFELIIPPLNAPLLIFKHVRSLCLPLDIYAGARNLGKVLELEYSWPNTIARHQVSAWPEVQIMGLIVIASKLSQRFDDRKRLPQSVEDPTALTIEWSVWQEGFRETESPGLKKGEEINLKSTDVLDMDEQQLDEYMDWYQKVWLDDRDPKMPQQILDLFPLEEPSRGSEQSEKNTSQDSVSITHLERVQKSLKWRNPVDVDPDENLYWLKRPGTFYAHYRTVEELPSPLKEFQAHAAKFAGISLDTLTRAVFMLEMKLKNYVALEKRKRLAEEWDGLDDSETTTVSQENNIGATETEHVGSHAMDRDTD